ncbi:MAG: hypothetical protein QOI55_2805 [Actinomycetota bacterium]|nr:hypothetical protein [Actinomycetota bacterium]
MPVVPLTNDAWGFETNCFVCEPRNVTGLQIPFFADTDRDIVFADFSLSRDFSGAPMWVHGGVSLAIVDEAMAWAVIALRNRWAVTKDVTASYHRPIEVDGAYRVEARVAADGEQRVRTEATILGDARQPHLSAWSEMVVYSAVKAPDMLGVDVPDELRGYLDQ